MRCSVTALDVFGSLQMAEIFQRTETHKEFPAARGKIYLWSSGQWRGPQILQSVHVHLGRVMVSDLAAGRSFISSNWILKCARGITVAVFFQIHKYSK